MRQNMNILYADIHFALDLFLDGGNFTGHRRSNKTWSSGISCLTRKGKCKGFNDHISQCNINVLAEDKCIHFKRFYF